MPYRKPGTIWKPVEGNRKRFLCYFLGHQTETLLTERVRVEPPDVKDAPHPGGQAFPQTFVLHWISDIVYRALRCKRCGKEWLHTEHQSNEKPLEYIGQYFVLR